MRRANLTTRIRTIASWALLGAACCMTLGCGEETGAAPMRNPIAGLYTPGSTLGASDPTDVPLPGMGLGERCVALSDDGNAADGGAAGGSPGELVVDYQTQSLMGRYAPKNCTAVWIETTDGRYVTTLELTAALRRPGLVYFQEHACVEELGPDAITSATLSDHMKPHKAKWSGADFQGLPMPDGPYKLFIEVTESDKEPGEVASFDVIKSSGFELEAPVDAAGPLLSVHVAWVLDTGGGSVFP
jgi:hypothetical protein